MTVFFKMLFAAAVLYVRMALYAGSAITVFAVTTLLLGRVGLVVPFGSLAASSTTGASSPSLGYTAAALLALGSAFGALGWLVGRFVRDGEAHGDWNLAAVQCAETCEEPYVDLAALDARVASLEAVVYSLNRDKPDRGSIEP